MTVIVILNGDFIDGRDAKISVFDPGFLLGIGVFTTIKIDNGKIEFYERHIKRLKSHLRKLGLRYPKIKKEQLLKLIQINKAFIGPWRLKIIVTGENYVITLEPYREIKTKRYHLTMFQEPVENPLAKVKTLSYAFRYYIADFAKKGGFFDAITTNANGYLLEACFSNIFWRDKNFLYTPSPKLQLMYGVSLAVIEESGKKLGMEIKKGRYTLDMIPDSAQVFLSSSLKHFKAVDAIDKRKFKRDKPFEDKLTKAYNIIKNQASRW